ncbi:MAG: type II secretion system protein GspD [Candidatus Omnitrophica bacterium]|nr:type II secretion system protein GspD [Candidatus Omnitrophota bacterium]
MRQERVLVLVAGALILAANGVEAQNRTEGSEGRPLTMTVVSGGANPAPDGAEHEPGTQLVSMDFQDAGLKDVLKIFSQQTGLNVIASRDIKDQTITLYLESVASLDALDQILASSGLIYERAPGSQIYIVKPAPAPEQPKITTETRVYRLKFARVSTSRLAKAAEALGAITPFESRQLAATGTVGASGTGGSSSLGVSGSDSGGYGSSGVSGVSSSGEGASGSAQEVGVDKVIAKLLTKEGQVVVDERTNSLVVTDIPESFPRIESALNALDVKTAQILIEAEVLETTLSKLKDLGVEWGADSEGSLFTVTPAQRSTRFPFIRQSEEGQKQDIIGPESTSLPAFTRSGQISLGTIDASQFMAVLQALQRDTDTKILARPKVLTLDNESAVIRLSSLQAIATQTQQTTVAGGTGVTTTAPERVTTGVILTVTPQVNDDQYVTMLIEPSVTKVITSQISTSIKDPKTRSARAMVRIRQGETLVLGGLIDRSESETLQKVPILGDIPLLGQAFRNTEIDNTATELIVFVTPRILAEPSVATQVVAAASPPAFQSREQEDLSSRQEEMENVLNQLEEPSP